MSRATILQQSDSASPSSTSEHLDSARSPSHPRRLFPCVQVGGVRTTNQETEEQWDAPNAWSPVVHMIIEGLETVGCHDASDLALQITRDWLASNHLGWANTGQMYEKYNAVLSGARGEGGEYYPQVGFGWTNGVVLHLLKTYANKL